MKMDESTLAIVTIITIFIQFPTHTVPSPTTTATLPNNKYIQYIKKSCNDTTYPKLCYKSLSTYANEIQTDQKLLVLASLNVTLKSTKSTSSFFKNMSDDHTLKPREAAAAADCVEVVGDAVYELKSSIEEMRHIGRSSFYKVINDVQTWVSAALTDDDTCTDGFGDINDEGTDPNVRNNVKRHIEKIAHLTSNALALINRYASTQYAKQGYVA